MEDKKPKYREIHGTTRVGDFLRGLKKNVLPSVLEAVGVGDLAKAVGIISNDPNNGGLTQEESEQFFKLVELDIEDRASARLMQGEALKQNDVFSKRFIYYLSIGVMGFVFIVITALFFVTVPKDNKTIIDMVIGIVMGGYTSIMAFFFGSSSGSKEKTNLMGKLR